LRFGLNLNPATVIGHVIKAGFRSRHVSDRCVTSRHDVIYF